MRIVIQNCVSGEYLKSVGAHTEWTGDMKKALRFRSSQAAMVCCVDNRIPHAQIVLKFDYDHDGEYDITLPVSRECKEVAGKL